MKPDAKVFINSSLAAHLLLMLLACLFVPAAQGQTVLDHDWRYTVRPQDTLYSLTKQYLKPSVSWQALAQYNRLSDPNQISTGLQLRVPLRWLSFRQAQAELTNLSGDVQVQALSGTWQIAQKGQMLQVGQQVKVGRNSSASLLFADESVMIIQPLSSVTLDTLSMYAGGYMVDTQLRLQFGRVEVHANPRGRAGQRFKVTTPSAVASVRGTQFVVEAQAQRTIEHTTQGQVALETPQGSVLVPEGYVSAVKLGEAPLPPAVIKPAPVLVSPAKRFTDFPIIFNWIAQNHVSSWVMQLGQDPQMAQLVLTGQSNHPQLDAAGLPDGNYHLRAWTLDANGLPSQAVQHAFEVSIPRKLQGAAVALPPSYFLSGPVSLQLPPLADGQRYAVQITEDAEGRLSIWHKANVNQELILPQLAKSESTLYMWVWVY